MVKLLIILLISFNTSKKQSRYSLRSNESTFLELPGIKTHPTLGDRAFQSAAPYLWNALPSEIRNMNLLPDARPSRPILAVKKSLIFKP